MQLLRLLGDVLQIALVRERHSHRHDREDVDAGNQPLLRPKGLHRGRRHSTNTATGRAHAKPLGQRTRSRPADALDMSHGPFASRRAQRPVRITTASPEWIWTPVFASHASRSRAA